MNENVEQLKLATFTSGPKTHYGLITDEGAIALDPYFDAPTLYEVIAQGQFERLVELARTTPKDAERITDFDYEMVLPDTRRILCVGVNFPNRNAEYKDGSQQPEYMSLFPRFASGFTAHQKPLMRPPESHTLDYEGEVAIVIGKPGRRIKATDAYDHICALTICNEGTIREWVRHAKFNVTQGKNWDNTAALGPWLTPFDNPTQLDEARITTHVNGEKRQDDVLANMMFPIRKEIEYISTFMTLQPGDVIVTGTPTGAGARLDPPQYLEPGDTIEVCVTGIGTLTNTVSDE